MHPYHDEILMKDIEHRMEAMGYCQLFIVSPDPKLTVGVDVHVRDIHLRLVPVNVVYLSLIEYHLSGVNLDECLLTGGCHSTELILVLTFLA